MESAQSRLYLMKIDTSESSVLNAWNWLADTLALVATGCVRQFQLYSGEKSWKRYILIMALHGKNRILVKIFGSLENEQLLLDQAKEALLAEVWAIYQSFSTELIAKNPKVASLVQSMAQAVQWEELKPKGKHAEIPGVGLLKDLCDEIGYATHKIPLPKAPK